MKKLLAIAAAAVAFFALTPAEAQAGHRSKVIGHCNHCHKSIHAYYKPVRYSDGCVRYVWVPAYHNQCSSARRHSSSRYHSARRSYRPSYRSIRRNSCSSSGVTFRFGRGSITIR